MKTRFWLRVCAVLFLLFVLFVLFFWPAILIKNHAEEERVEQIQNTIAALERLIEHLFAVGDNINLDGVFAARLVEDQLKSLLVNVVRPYYSKDSNDKYLYITERLVFLKIRVMEFGMEFTKIVERNQPEYFKMMGFWLVATNWEMWYPQRDIDRSLMPTYGFLNIRNDSKVGPISDRCMVEPYFNKCQFSKQCWDYMEFKFYYGFSLTHEVLFILNAFAVGCGVEAEIAARRWSGMGLEKLGAQECANILHEAELIANKEYPSYHRDLFMEQIALCGMLGYRDFFRNEWLKKILSWQKESGCYSVNYTDSLDDYNENIRQDTMPEEPKDRQSLHTKDGDPYTTHKTHDRRKRTEQTLSDGCLAHMTGVAAVALGQYIRFLLEPLLTNNPID